MTTAAPTKTRKRATVRSSRPRSRRSVSARWASRSAASGRGSALTRRSSPRRRALPRSASAWWAYPRPPGRRVRFEYRPRSAATLGGCLARGAGAAARGRARADPPGEGRRVARHFIEDGARDRGLGSAPGLQERAGDVDPKRRALAHAARDRPGAAERAHELLHDDEPEPDPARPPRAARTALVEGLE